MAILANYFVKRHGVIIHLILYGKNRDISFPISSEIIIHKPDFNFTDNYRLYSTLKTLFFIRKTVKSIQPDTILSFGELWNNLVLLALYRLKYPVFISDRSQPAKDLGKFHNILRKMLYPKAAGYIAQTEKAKKICLSNGWNNKVEVIGNPIRKIEISDQEERKNIILSVGRLIKTKHFDQLITMFVEIGKPDWKLVIVGGDAKGLKLFDKLNELIHKLGAEKLISMEGEQKNIDQYYHKSKIFAFTSSSEGFPNVIGEALSAGLPAVSYNCIAGPSDMIEDGENGFLVPLFDMRLYKKKLSLLMEDEQIRKQMSNNSRGLISRFDSTKISEKFLNFIT